MSDLNIRYSNCFDFINNTKQYLEANPTDWRNIYTEEALVRAECDLMEMELEASYDAEEYDSIMNGNTFRTSKRAQRRKANIRRHKADRYHGKCFEGREDGKRIYKDRYCRFPVSDRVRNHSALKAEAREEDYFLNPCASALRKEKEEAEKARREQEKADKMSAFWTALKGLPDTRFVVLCNYDNGGEWEDNIHSENLFLDIMSKEQVVGHLKTQCVIKAEYDQLPTICEKTVVCVVNGNKKGICFRFEDKDYPEYEEFVLIPLIPR